MKKLGFTEKNKINKIKLFMKFCLCVPCQLSPKYQRAPKTPLEHHVVYNQNPGTFRNFSSTEIPDFSLL